MKNIFDTVAPNRHLVLYPGDCVELIKTLPNESVDLTVTSPPYCMGKAYEDAKDVTKFIEDHRTLLPEIVRITKQGGSICWQVGYHVKNKVVYPLDYAIFSIMNNIEDIVLRNRIIWTFGHGTHATSRFSGRHEQILWFTKGRDYYFDLDSVRVPQKYPGKRHYKGPKKGDWSGNPKGKNPGDVWEIPNVKANHVEKVDHPCQFPIAVVKRLINALTKPDGTVFDPFAGSGTTGAAAILAGRKFIGAEANTKYFTIAKERMLAAARDTLRYRPENKAIHEPRVTDAVAKRPGHFAATSVGILRRP